METLIYQNPSITRKQEEIPIPPNPPHPDTAKDYWKAVWANKATLTGYTLMTVGVALTWNQTIPMLDEPVSLLPMLGPFTVYVGFLSGSITSFGVDTVRAYRRAREHINTHGTLDTRYATKYHTSWYCTAVGIRLAAKEAGLEQLLQKRPTATAFNAWENRQETQ